MSRRGCPGPASSVAATPNELQPLDVARDRPPLRAPIAAGVFELGHSMPTRTFMNTNYWIDVVVR